MAATPRTEKKQPVSLQDRLAEKAVKTMEKATEQQTMQRLQQGQAPQEILNSLLSSVNQVAQQKVPVEGTMQGIIPALGQAIRGNGFKPFAPQEQSLGFDNALQLMNLQNNVGAEQRRQYKDARQAPGDLAKSASLILKAARDQAMIAGDYSMLNLLSQNQQKQQYDLSDPISTSSGQGYRQTGQMQDLAIDPAFRQQFGEQNVQRIGDARKELDKYTRTITPVINDVLKFQEIAEQLPDYKGGIFNQIIARGDTVAKAIAADPVVTRFNSAIDRSLGGLVKYGGDSGALNEDEQLRAKSAIGKTNLPFAEKIQIYSDTLEKVFAGLDVRKEQAQDPNYDKRFPMIAKARQRYEGNKKYLESKKEDKTTIKVGEFTVTRA